MPGVGCDAADAREEHGRGGDPDYLHRSQGSFMRKGRWSTMSWWHARTAAVAAAGFPEPDGGCCDNAGCAASLGRAEDTAGGLPAADAGPSPKWNERERPEHLPMISVVAPTALRCTQHAPAASLATGQARQHGRSSRTNIGRCTHKDGHSSHIAPALEHVVDDLGGHVAPSLAIIQLVRILHHTGHLLLSRKSLI